MANKEVVEYIIKFLSQGVDETQIRTALKESGGWNDSEIDAAFQAARIQMAQSDASRASEYGYFGPNIQNPSNPLGQNQANTNNSWAQNTQQPQFGGPQQNLGTQQVGANLGQQGNQYGPNQQPSWQPESPHFGQSVGQGAPHQTQPQDTQANIGAPQWQNPTLDTHNNQSLGGINHETTINQNTPTADYQQYGPHQTSTPPTAPNVGQQWQSPQGGLSSQPAQTPHWEGGFSQEPVSPQQNTPPQSTQQPPHHTFEAPVAPQQPAAETKFEPNTVQNEPETFNQSYGMVFGPESSPPQPQNFEVPQSPSQNNTFFSNTQKNTFGYSIPKGAEDIYGGSSPVIEQSIADTRSFDDGGHIQSSIESIKTTDRTSKLISIIMLSVVMLLLIIILLYLFSPPFREILIKANIISTSTGI